MNAKQQLTAMLAASLLVSAQSLQAANQKEEDSAYQWGRWAVLSPAAGGEPYRAPLESSVDYNARPGDISEFQPTIVQTQQRIGIVDINPDIPVVTAPPTVAPPPPPPPPAPVAPQARR